MYAILEAQAIADVAEELATEVRRYAEHGRRLQKTVTNALKPGAKLHPEIRRDKPTVPADILDGVDPAQVRASACAEAENCRRTAALLQRFSDTALRPRAGATPGAEPPKTLREDILHARTRITIAVNSADVYERTAVEATKAAEDGVSRLDHMLQQRRVVRDHLREMAATEADAA